MAENRTINIKINQNADEATQDFKKYNKEVGNTKKAYDAVLKSGKPYEQQLADINKIVKETPLNVRDMNKQIQAYQSIALSAGRETPVGREALKAAADLRDRYVDIQNETKRLADDQKNLEGAMQGVATGVAVYGGIQSAMALSGVESEKLRETLVKLQAAQTLMNSINQVATAFEKESALMLTLKSAKTKALTVATAAYATVTGTATGAMKAFRIALVSTGIGAIIVGLGLLIANFDKVTAAVSNVTKSFKEGGAVTKALMIAFAPLIATIKLVTMGLEALGIIESEEDKAKEERHQAEMARIEKENEARKRAFDARQKQFDREIAMLDAEGKSSFALRQQKLADSIAVQKQEAKAYETTIALIEGHMKALGQATGILDEYKGKLTEINESIKDQENQLKINVINNNKEKADSYKNYANERRNAARQIEDLENALLKDGIEKELEINKDKFDRLIADTKKNTKLTRQERNRLIELYEEQGQQKAEEIRAKYRQKEIDAERKQQQKIEADKNKFLDEIAEIEEANYQALLSDEERELLAVQDKYFRLEEMAKDNAEQLAIIQEARMNEENAIFLKYSEEQYQNEKALNDKKLEDEKAVADAKKSIQDAQIANVEAGISLLKDVAGKNNKLQALAIAAENAVGIAKIIISTQAANAAAKLKYAAIPGGLALAAAEITANKISAGIGIAASVAAAAKGIAALKSSAPLESGGDVGGAAGGSETIAPEFNIVGDAGVNQLAQIQQQPVQAFVVSGEVTTSQALDRNRVQNATL